MGLLDPRDAEGTDDEMVAVFNAAYRETLEEAGALISNVEVVGRLTPTTMFIPHSSYVVKARVEMLASRRPDNKEIISDAEWFDFSELKNLNLSSDLLDGRTIAALSLAGIQIG